MNNAFFIALYQGSKNINHVMLTCIRQLNNYLIGCNTKQGDFWENSLLEYKQETVKWPIKSKISMQTKQPSNIKYMY